MKKSCEKLDLRVDDDKRTPNRSERERTLKVNCSNCGARLVAYCGDNQESVETVEATSRELRHGDAFRRDNFQGATIRLLA